MDTMRSYTIIAGLFVFLLATACDKEEEVDPRTSCAGIVEHTFGQPMCGEFAIPDHLCTLEDIGSYAITEKSKQVLRDYCLVTGQVVTFESATGNIIDMEVYQKEYKTSVSGYNIFEACPQDSSRQRGYCMTHERLVVGLRTVDNTLDILLTIKTRPDTRNPDPERVGDVLEISRKKDSNSRYLEFMAIVDARTMSFSQFEGITFFPAITLDGKPFDAVISNVPWSSTVPPPYQYFYSEIDGLVGFVDSEGELWVRVE